MPFPSNGSRNTKTIICKLIVNYLLLTIDTVRAYDGVNKLNWIELNTQNEAALTSIVLRPVETEQKKKIKNEYAKCKIDF